MQARQMDRNRWVLVLDRGEELVSTVTGFLGEHDVRAGFVTGLGALRNHVMGWYDLVKQEYVKRTFEEVMELGNLTGSVALVDGSPFLHAHVTVSGPELIAFSGHLIKGEVAVTAELFLTVLDGEMARETDETVGVRLLRLDSSPGAAAEEPGPEEGDEA